MGTIKISSPEKSVDSFNNSKRVQREQSRSLHNVTRKTISKTLIRDYVRNTIHVANAHSDMSSQKKPILKIVMKNGGSI